MSLILLIAAADRELPDEFYVSEGETFSLAGFFSAAEEDQALSAALSGELPPRAAELRLFGLIPVKTVRMSTEAEEQVLLGGELFGVKMLCDGAIVVKISGVETADGFVSPAKDAGFEVGDIIRSLDDEEISGGSDFSEKLNRSGGGKVTVGVLRGEKTLFFALSPARSARENLLRGGMWVKDSSAGIGTLTFLDPQSGAFGGLGHGICEAESGVLIPISSGEIEKVRLIGCKKAVSGAAGQLQGYFEGGVIGKAALNTETGIYGTLFSEDPGGETVCVAHKQNVKKGAAQILATVDETGPQLYEVEIERVRFGENRQTKNLQIRVTDPRLIEKTGGILQGMSGSPILQEGKLVGAVTHVFLGDPKRGYGIFAETMLRTAQSCAAA